MSNDANGIVQSILNLGEERMGEVINQLLANDTFVTMIQSTITSSLAAKQTVDKRLLGLLSTFNVPSLEDVEALSGKLDELEDLLAEVEDRIHRIREDAEHKKSRTGDEEKPARRPAKKRVSSKKSEG